MYKRQEGNQLSGGSHHAGAESADRRTSGVEKMKMTDQRISGEGKTKMTDPRTPDAGKQQGR